MKKLKGFEVVRCDDIDAPGWVHRRMVKHIFEDSVATVDTSTLNANVFYELGVRHALRKGATVLIQREGTAWPFNIAGMNSIPYTTNPRGVKAAVAAIAKFISDALGDPAHVDSLVYEALPDLRVPTRDEERITKVQVFEYGLKSRPGKRLGPVTGDRELHAERCIGAAVNYLEANPGSCVEAVYFYVWTNHGLEVCQRIMARHGAPVSA